MQPKRQGPLVTVVMTVFHPDHEDTLHAARSILRQSWEHLELLIIDDGSPDDFAETLDALEALDERVRLLRMPVNQGTYRSRNVGLAEAHGEYVTGQDSDDWSHPQRIETEVNTLRRNPDLPGVMTRAIRTDDDLMRVRTGQLPSRRCEVSFMLKTELAREVGGYLTARKSADSEFRERVIRYSGADVPTIDEPLYLIRLSPQSLSRGDFRPGWSHPSRRAFWSACLHWHRTAANEELTSPEASPVPIPRRFQVEPAAERRAFDVVFVDDWRKTDYFTSGPLEEARALVRRGKRVGIMNYPSSKSLARGGTATDPSVQRLINEEAIRLLLPDEDADIDLLVVRDPSVVQFVAPEPITAAPRDVRIVASEPPRSKDGSIPIYDPATCLENAEYMFGGKVRWVAQDAATRDTLAAECGDAVVASGLMPILVDPHDWQASPRARRTRTPILGCILTGHPAEVARSREDLAEVLPADGSVEVRMRGYPAPVLKTLGRSRLPRDWVRFSHLDVSRRAFLNGIDVYVHYPVEEFDDVIPRSVLEAMAMGKVVMTTPEVAERLDGAVIGVEPSEVRARTIEGLNKDTDRGALLRRASELIEERHAPVRFVEWFDAELDACSTQGRGGQADEG